MQSPIIKGQRDCYIFFLNGNKVLELREANLDNCLIVYASRLSIYNFFEHLDFSSVANNFLRNIRLDLTLIYSVKIKFFIFLFKHLYCLLMSELNLPLIYSNAKAKNKIMLF